MTITEANTPEELAAVGELFRAYSDFLVSKGIGVNLSGLDEEIASLPGTYAKGALLLAKNDAGEAIGCVALKPRILQNGEKSVELKRLWTTPAARGTGAGKALMRASEAWARAHGYASIVLDTEPNKMPEAVCLYESLGYQPIDSFNDNPVPNIVYFRLAL